MKKTRAIVVGAGIGGLTAAIALRRIGVDVEIYEGAKELRPIGAALSIMSNAVLALRSLGIFGLVEERGQIIESVRFWESRGTLIRSVPIRELGDELGAPSVCIERAALQNGLLEEAKGIPLHMGARIADFEESGGRVRATFKDGREAEADFLVGSDGIGSVVREKLVGGPPPRHAGHACYISILPFKHERFTVGSVSHYWGRGQRVGIFDVGGGRAQWWATKNVSAPVGNGRPSRAFVASMFAGWADQVTQIIDQTPEGTILQLDAHDRGKTRVWGRGHVTMMGDAAHPMLMTLGQGGCMAIEDAVVLARCLKDQDAIEPALRRFERERQPRADKLALMTRMMSDMEHLTNAAACAARNAYMRWVPGQILYRANKDMMSFDAEAA